MIRKFIAFGLGLSLAGMAPFSAAAPTMSAYSTQALVAECKVEMAVLKNGPSTSNLASAEHELTNAAICVSYVSGFRDGVQVGSFQHPHPTICIPKATTNAQLVQVYLQYVESHPDTLTKSREISAFLAFGTAYRCGQHAG